MRSNFNILLVNTISFLLHRASSLHVGGHDGEIKSAKSVVRVRSIISTNSAAWVDISRPPQLVSSSHVTVSEGRLRGCRYLSVRIPALNMHQWIHICCHAFVLTCPEHVRSMVPACHCLVSLMGDWYGCDVSLLRPPPSLIFPLEGIPTIPKEPYLYSAVDF